MKSHGKCLVFCALLIFVGCLTVVNASEISDNTTNVVYDDIQSIDTQEQYTQEIIKTEDVMEKQVSKKELTTEDVKTEKQVTVNNYQQLFEEVENAKKGTEKTYTINLNKGNYNVTNEILLNNYPNAKKIIINGNNNIISGNGYSFFGVTSKNTLELNNITLTNFNTAIHSGGGTIFLSNCNFSKNNGYTGFESPSEGGVMRLSYGNVIVSDCIFDSNYADYGGAISSLSANISLSNCTFTNNKALEAGGAIFSYNNISLSNCTFTNNKAYAGGAIYSCSEVMLVDCNLNSNYAGYGGALSLNYRGNVSLSNSNLSNNKASKTGGAIYSCGDAMLSDCNLNSNYADCGGAISLKDTNCSIINTVLSNNTADNYGGAIFNDLSSVNMENSTFISNKAKEGNDFYKNQIITEIIIYNITEKEYKDSVTITGFIEQLNEDEGYYDDWDMIPYKEKRVNFNLDLYINNVKKTLTTYYNEFSTTVKLNRTGIWEVKAIFHGKDNYYLPSNASMSFNVSKRKTVINYNVSDLFLNKESTLAGNLTDKTNNTLGNVNVYITINGEEYHVLTDKNGTYTLNYTPTKPGTNNITILYKGNKNYEASNFTTSFQVTNKTATTITINPIKAVQKDSTITITGKYADINGNNLRYTPIVITINGQTYKNSTDAKGIYTYTYKATTSGTNNITVSYPGNSRYEGATAKTTFQVTGKTATNITVNSIGSVQKDSFVTITGKYTDINGNNLRYTPIKITINGQTYTNSTDANGVYKYNYKAATQGTNNITVSYQGNSRYEGATAKTSFQVIGKTATKITVNSIGTVEKDSLVTITGKYTDINGNNLRYTPIKITINGQTYTNNTDANGVYTYNYKTTTQGTNNITVTYPGNSRYEGATAKTTFQVTGKTVTTLTVNSIGTVLTGTTVTITGKYTDINGNNLRYTPIKITINGQTYTNSTDVNGVYTYNYKTTTQGTNNITVSYLGNSRYYGATATTTFQVTNKLATKITVNSKGTVKRGTTVTITGKYTDINGNNLRYTPIKITINGQTYTNSTDANGVYTYNYKTTTQGTNNITVTYPGNSRYEGATAKTTLQVI